MDAQQRSTLILVWQDRRIALDERQRILSLGSRADTDLRLERPWISRSHARIERRKHDYVLVDDSTNGTFVQTEDEQVAFVRRGEIRLWGEGWISLGEPLTPESALRFRHG